MDRRTGSAVGSTRTPGKKQRAFGTKLSANSPLPSQLRRDDDYDPASKSAFKSVAQASSRTQQLRSANKKASAQLIPPRSISKTAERGDALKSNSGPSSTTHQQLQQLLSDNAATPGRRQQQSSSSILKTPDHRKWTDAAANINTNNNMNANSSSSSSSVHRGKNLMANFNSPSIITTAHYGSTKHGASSTRQEKEPFTPKGGQRKEPPGWTTGTGTATDITEGSTSHKKWTRFTPKISWKRSSRDYEDASSAGNKNSSNNDGAAPTPASAASSTAASSLAYSTVDATSLSYSPENKMAPSKYETTSMYHRSSSSSSMLYSSSSANGTQKQMQQQQQQQVVVVANLPTTPATAGSFAAAIKPSSSTVVTTAAIAPMILSTTTAAAAVSPTNSTLSTTTLASTSTISTTATALASISKSSLPEKNTLGPSEYAIQFPPGEMYVEFEPVVTTTGGRPTGCSVAKILEEFDPTKVRYLPAEWAYSGEQQGEQSNNGGTTTTTKMIQVNDLVVSINGIPTLSRKYDIIASLLQKFSNTPKTIVFRSIERLWKSQFSRRTMRHLRTGKRVATALNTEEFMLMDNNGDGSEGGLYSWVETPTQVEVRNRRGRKNTGERRASGDSSGDDTSGDGMDGGGSSSSAMMDQEATRANAEVVGERRRKKLESIRESMTIVTASSPSVAVASSPAVAAPSTLSGASFLSSLPLMTSPGSIVATTPSTLGSTASPSCLFSPSNVRKMTSLGNSASPSHLFTPSNSRKMTSPSNMVVSTPAPQQRPSSSSRSGGEAEFLAATVKKSNVGRISRVTTANNTTIGTPVSQNRQCNNGNSSGSNTRSKLAERIGKVLVGQDYSVGTSGDFERSLRLKKGVLQELKNVHLEITKLRTTNDEKDDQINDMSRELNEQITIMSREIANHRATHTEVMEEALGVQLTLEKEVESLKEERYETLKGAIDVQGRLDETAARVQELEHAVEESKQSELASQEAVVTLEKVIASLEKDAPEMKAKLEDATARVQELERTVEASHQSSQEAVATLEKHVAAKDKLLEERSTHFEAQLSTLTDELSKAKDDADVSSKALEEESLSFGQRDAAWTDEVRGLEERLEAEEQKAIESTNEYSELVAKLEDRITAVESDRDAARLDLAKEKLSSLSLTAELAKATQDAEMASNALEEERLHYSQSGDDLVSQVRSLEDRLAGAERKTAKSNKRLLNASEKAIENAKDHSAVVSKLEERIIVAESDRDVARLDLEKEKLASSAVSVDLAKSVEDAAAASNALEEERLSFSQRDAARDEQVRALDERLAEEEQKALELTNDHTAAVAKLMESITVVESDRDAVRLQLEKEEVTTSALAADSAKAKEDADVAAKSLEEERSNFSQRDAARDDQVHALEARLAEEEKRITVVKSDRDAARLDLQKEQYALANAVEGTNMALKALEEERLSFQQRDAIHVESVRSLEERLACETAAVAELEERISGVEAELEKETSSSSALMEDMAKANEDVEVTSKVFEEERLTASQRESTLVEKVSSLEIQLATEEQKALDSAKDHLQSQALMGSLQGQLAARKEEHENVVGTLNGQISSFQEEATAKHAELESKLEASIESNTKLTDQVSSLKDANKDVAQLLCETEAALEEAQSNIAVLKEDASSVASQKVAAEERAAKLESVLEEAKSNIATLSENASSAVLQLATAEEHATTLESSLTSEKQAAAAKLAQCDGKLGASEVTITKLTDQVSSLVKLVTAKEAALEESKSTITSVKEEALSEKSQLTDEATKLRNTKEALEERVTTLEDTIQSLQQATNEKHNLSCQLSQLQAKNDSIQSSSAKTEEELRRDLSKLEGEITSLNQTITSSNCRIEILENDISMFSTERYELTNQAEATSRELSAMQDDVFRYSLKIEEMQSTIEELGSERDTAGERVKELTSRIEINTEAMSGLQFEKDGLVLKLEQTNSQLEATESERDECLNKMELGINEKEKMLMKIEDTETRHAEAVEQCTQEVDSLTKQLSTVSTEKEELVAKIESANSELTAMQGEAESQATKISNLESSIESLTAERDTSNARVFELLSGNKDAEGVISSLQFEKDELTLNLELVRAAIALLEMEKGEAVAELDGLKVKNSELQTQIEDATANCNAVETGKRDYQDKLERVTGEKQTIASELAKVETTSKDTVARLEVSIQKNTEEIDALNKAIASSNEQVVQFKAHVSTLAQERNALSKKTEETKADLTKMKDIVEEDRRSLLNQVRDVEERLQEEAQKVEILEERISAAETDRDYSRLDLEKEKSSSSEREQKLLGDLGHTQGEASQNREMCIDLQNDLASLQDLEKSLKGRIEALESEVESHQVEIAKLDATNESLETERSHLIGHIQLLELEVSEGNVEKASELQSLSSALRATHDEITVLKSGRLRLDDEISDLKSNLSLSEEKLESDRESFESRERTLEDEMMDLKGKLASIDTTNTHSHAMVESLTAKLVESENSLALLTVEMEQCRAEFDAERETLTHELERRTAEIFTLQSSQNALTEQLNEVSTKLEDTRSKAVNAKAEIMAEVSELSKKLDESHDHVTQLEALTDALKSKLDTAETFLDEGDAEIQSLSNDCERLETQVNDLHVSLENSEVALSQQKHQSQSLEMELSSVTTSRDELHSEKESIEAELAAKVTEVRGLTMTVESEVKELMDKLEMSEDETNQSKALAADLRYSLQSAEAQLGGTNADIQEFLNDRARLDKQVNDLNVLLENVDEASSNQKDEIASLTSELACLTAFRDNARSEMVLMTAELNAKGAEVRQLANQVGTLTSAKTKQDADSRELIKELNESQTRATLSDELRSKLESSESSLSESKVAIQILSQNCSILEKEVYDLQELLKSANEASSEKEEAIESLANDVTGVTASRDELCSENESILAQLKTKESERDSLGDRVHELTNQLQVKEESHASDQIQHKADERELLEKLEALQSDAQQREAHTAAEIRNLEEQVNDINALLEKSDDALSQQKDENQSLVLELASMTTSRDDLRRKKESLEVQLKSKQSEITKLDDRVSELTSQMQSKVESQLSSHMKHDEQVRELLGELEASHNDASQSKTLVAELQSKLEMAEYLADKTNTDTQNLSNDRDLLEKKLNDLNVLLDNANEDNSIQRDANQSLAIELANVTASRDDLCSKNGKVHAQLKSKLCESESLGDRVCSLTNQLHLMEDIQSSSQIKHDAEVNDLMKRLNEAQNDASESRALSDDLRSKLHAADASLGKMEKQVNDLNVSLEDSKETFSQQKDEHQSLALDLARMTAIRDDLRREKELIAADLISKGAEISSLGNSVKMLTNQISSGDADKTELFSKVSALEVDLAKSKSQLETQNTENSSLLSELGDLKTTFDDLTTQIRYIESQSHRQIKTYEGRQHELRSQKKDLTLTVDKLTAQVLQVEAQSRREIVSHQVNQKNLMSGNHDLQNAVSGLKIKCLHLTSELDDAKAALSAKDSELLEVASEKASLANELETSIKEIQVQKEEFDSKEKELSALLATQESDIQKERARLIDLSAELETVASTTKSKQQEICRLERGIFSLQSEGRESKDALEAKLNAAHTLFDSERVSLHSHIQHLEGELNQSREVLLQQKENEEKLAADLESLRKKILMGEQTEQDLCEHAQEMEHMLKARQGEIDRLADDICHEKAITDLATACHEKAITSLATEHKSNIQRVNRAHDNERNELEQRLSHHKDEVDNLRQMLQEGIALNASLSESRKEKERELHEKYRETEEFEATLTSMETMMAQAESASACEKQKLVDEIVQNRATIELQNLAMTTEKDALTQELEAANLTETMLRSKLQETDLELVQLYKDLACTRGDVVMAIAEAKSAADDAIHSLVSKFEAEKVELQRENQSLSSELLHQQDQFYKELSIKNEAMEASASSYTSEITSLKEEMGDIEQARLVLASTNAEMKGVIQQQENTFSKANKTYEHQMNRLHEQCHVAAKNLEVATIKWTHERSSYEHKVQSLHDEINEKRLLIKSQTARFEVSSILKQRDGTLDKMLDTVQRMGEACSEYHAEQSELDELTCTLKSREKSIKRISMDLSMAHDEIVSLRAEVECAKEIGRHEGWSTRDEHEGKLILLTEKFRKERSAFQSEWKSFQGALNELVGCIHHDGEDLPIEALPEMTSLLYTLFELFQAKADQVTCLQSELSESVLSTVEHELRDLCIQLEVPQLVQDFSLTQSEEINSMLHSLKVKVSGSNLTDKFPDDDALNDSREHHIAVCEFLAEIEDAKQKTADLGHKLENEAICRKQSEMQCIAGEEAIANAYEEIRTLEQRIQEMDESAQLQSEEVKDLESRLQREQDQQRNLANRVRDMDESDQLQTKELKDLYSHLQHVEGQKRKSELKCERSQAEIESCQKHAIELKTIIIEKNKEIESKEGNIMQLQYKIDDISAKADGWRASFEGLVTDAGSDVSSPDDVADILVASTERQDTLSAEIAKLEEQRLHTNEDFRQQTSMYKAIMEGLETQCEMLSEENADICDELKEKEDYIVTLEETKGRLEFNVDMHKKECEDAGRKFSDLQKSCKILRQQKIDSESLSNEVVSGVRKMTGIVSVHAVKLEGFSRNLIPRATWSENLDYIAHFIEHASTMNQKYLLLQSSSAGNLVTAEAITPKAKGSDGSLSITKLASTHSDMLEDLKNMKTAIANVMNSPRLTPMKSGRQDNTNVQRNDEFDEDLYSDLLRAHEQLESLSKKIEYFQGRILDLEKENKIIKATPPALLESDEEKMKEAGAVMMHNFQKRCQRAVMQQAFQTWSSKARMSQHLSIAKAMAKELVQTRKTVLLLKSHLDENDE